MQSLAIYIHWPFCKFKCPYCDFNSHVREKINHRDWIDAYVRELKFYRDKTGERHIESIFFGGGTPSLMEPTTVAAVIDEVARLWGLPQGAEITLEANPTSVEMEKMQGFKTAGVNRVSLGVQALRDHDLKKLGRQHSAREAMDAVHLAARVFNRFSFDLIYARPDQSVSDWRQELGEALEHAGGHLSLYQLTIEEGTSFYTLHQRGDLKVPDEDTAAALYETTQEIMDRRGMPAYEVSNHARPGDESRHNLMYWRYQDYVGVGPGAHGRLTFDSQKWATRAHRAPEVWMQNVMQQGHGAHPFEIIDLNQQNVEKIMMGLRLSEGVALDIFQNEGQNAPLRFINQDRLQDLLRAGFVEQTGTRLKATPAGRQRLNAVLSSLLSG